MILKTYLYNNCYICGSTQIDDNNLKNNDNIFTYCLSCSKIFCKNECCLFLHKLKCQNINSIDINLMKNIYLKHYIILNEKKCFTWYCITENKNICDACYSEENKAHKIIYKMENAPIEIDNIKEEENILLKIIEY